VNDLEQFEQAWKLYPRKVAKAEARKAWGQVKEFRPDIETLLTAIKNACKQEQWMKNGGAFIPHFSTWLRGERWDDEFEIVLPNVVNEKPWHETATGIELKGRELGLNPDDYPTFPAFRVAVMQASLKAA
jgi:2'-5' RNA ligase